MPHKCVKARREYRRRKYAEAKAKGETRNWGKVTCICPVCENVRELSKNSHGITKLSRDAEDRIIKRCRSCSKRKDYAPSQDPEHRRDYSRLKRQALKVRAIQHKGGRCLHCGLKYNGTNGSAFDFHHHTNDDKDFAIASKNYAWPKVEAELEKCHLLCVICHRAVHSDQY